MGTGQADLTRFRPKRAVSQAAREDIWSESEIRVADTFYDRRPQITSGEESVGKVRSSIRILVPTIGAVLCLSPAASAAVPKKDYACYGEAGTYIATLEIKTATKYRYLGDGGKYRVKGRVLTFRSGPLKKWVGRTFKASGDPAIKLVTKQAGGQTVNCYS